MKLVRSSMLVLVCLIIPAAVCAQETCDIGVYFDSGGTQRTADPACGQLVTLYVWGSGCTGFMAGAEYAVDYGPNLTFVADAGLPPVSVGFSDVGLGGISLGYGFSPRPGQQFLLQLAFANWNCTGDGCPPHNVDGPVVVANPTFGNTTPITQKFGVPFPGPPVPANGLRAQTCQLVELDIAPGRCPNQFKAHSWKYALNGQPTKGGKLKAAILASSSVDVADIDPASVRLEGVAPTSWKMMDVGMPDGDNDCECDEGSGKDGGSGKTSGGDPDLVFEFSNPEIAAAIGLEPPADGTEVVLTMTGAYNDGLPFTSTGCVVIKGRLKGKGDGHQDDHGSGKSGGFATAALGYPSPNPFNPVTRISYNVPSTQHVHIAIYDVAGRLVENLVNEVKAGGEYVVEWDAGRLPSGVYFYRMQTADKTIVRRATLLK